ncbi:hypothetical protein BC332_10302 [Capsicum chinense]|nr:hypothetical protein BC332_10302 [Capsicum chinense]
MAGKGEGPAIGIDLGTTYSCVGVWKHDPIKIITNDQAYPDLPRQKGYFLGSALSRFFLSMLCGCSVV